MTHTHPLLCSLLCKCDCIGPYSYTHTHTHKLITLCTVHWPDHQSCIQMHRERSLYVNISDSIINMPTGWRIGHILEQHQAKDQLHSLYSLSVCVHTKGVCLCVCFEGTRSLCVPTGSCVKKEEERQKTHLLAHARTHTQTQTPSRQKGHACNRECVWSLINHKEPLCHRA